MKNFFSKLWIAFKVKFLQNIVDKNLWKYSNTDPSVYTLYSKLQKEELVKYYPQLENTNFENESNIYLDFYKNCFTEYVYKFGGPVFLDPVHQWVINGDANTVEKVSLPFHNDPWNLPTPMPSFVWHKLFYKTISVDEGLSVKFFWGNYYHFFYDTLTQILAFHKITNRHDVPVLVPAYLKKLRFLKEFNEISNLLKNVKFVYIETNQQVKVKHQLFLAKAISVDHQFIKQILASIDQTLFQITGKAKKVFLNRDKNKIRSLKNIDAVVELVKSYGYEIIDTENMSLRDQIRLFANVESVVGLHGAGLTNIIFRNGKPMKLFEIFNAEVQAEFYKRICKEFGYIHYSMVGSEPDINDRARFEIDLVEFENSLIKFEAIEVS